MLCVERKRERVYVMGVCVFKGRECVPCVKDRVFVYFMGIERVFAKGIERV